jgi:hypothetical protein
MLHSAKARLTLASAVIVTAAFVVFRPVLFGYFFDDDFQWLVGTWTFDASRVFDISQMTHFYRPVIDVYFAAATPLFGGSPTAFHVANVVIHAANALLLMALAREVAGRDDYAFLAALFWVVQPADVDTIAWISALAEAIGALFGCIALLSFLRFCRSGAGAWYTASVLAFALALVTHESSVVFLPLLALVDWSRGGWSRRSIARYVPFALLVLAYLLIDWRINRQNYLVTEGHYAIGLHMIANARDYVVALYVGKGNAANYAFVLAVIAAVLASRSRRVLCAGGWIAVALLPFVGFTWGTSFRYLYLPAMGFAMLMAEGVLQLDLLLARWLSPVPRRALTTLLIAALTIRFIAFGTTNVRSFAAHTEVYRRYMMAFKQTHPDLPRNSRIAVDAAGEKFAPKFLLAMLQWEYRDSSIELASSEPRHDSR